MSDSVKQEGPEWRKLYDSPRPHEAELPGRWNKLRSDYPPDWTLDSALVFPPELCIADTTTGHKTLPPLSYFGVSTYRYRCDTSGHSPRPTKADSCLFYPIAKSFFEVKTRWGQNIPLLTLLQPSRYSLAKPHRFQREREGNYFTLWIFTLWENFCFLFIFTGLGLGGEKNLRRENASSHRTPPPTDVEAKLL